MAERFAHLVGSLPGENTYEAMTAALDLLGPHLRSLPDGETGERRNWIISIIETLRHHPDLEVAKPGDWSDYDKTPTMRVRKGHRLYGANLDFGHVAAVRNSWPIFEELRATHGRPDLDFQSGVPSDLDMAMFTLGPVGALTHRRPFTEATLAEIRGVRDMTSDDTVFQLEMPVELVLLAKAPKPTRAVLAGRMAASINNLAAAAPSGTRFGLHLCLGDMNNKAFGTMGDANPLVLLSNAIVDGWPGHQRLDYVHAPLAAADQPPPEDRDFYAPLSELRLPESVRFTAGYAHEAQDIAAQRTVRGMIEDRLGGPVDVSAACGLGRRSKEDGLRVLERMAELVDD